jgi:hypothetical protein
MKPYSNRLKADSVEKTQLNVAFGYLAVLLGYLCLSEPVRKRFSHKNHSKGLGCLLDSIREFIALHRTIDDKSGANSLTGKLQNLVDSLVRKP